MYTKEKKKREKAIRPPKPAKHFSKKILEDIRPLLWIITLGGLLLAFYAIHQKFMGSLPWIASMVGLPWTAYGTVCSFYMNKSKAECLGPDKTGITFAKAAAANFVEEIQSKNSPKI